MYKIPNYQQQKVLLLISATGLTPIALLYGFQPHISMPYIFDIELNNVNLSHIMRAIMGLYFGQIIFWVLGAFNNLLRKPAMYSLTIFMLGLACGRILSLLLDGTPHGLLLLYLGLELTIGILSVISLRLEQ